MHKITYTADEEFPDCMKCDYVNCSDDTCIECGASNSWALYERTEIINEIEVERSENGS